MEDESLIVGKTVILVLIFIVSVTGNALVCYCGLHTQRMSAMNHIIVNLAASEILIAFLVIPIKIERELTGEIILGGTLCKLMEYVQTVALGASMMSLIMLSVDRYCSVFHPLSKITRRQAKHMMVFSWCYPLLCASPVMYYVLGTSHQPNALLLQCQHGHWHALTQLDRLYSLIQLWLVFLLPVLMVTMVYAVIVTRLLRTGSPTRGRITNVGPTTKPVQYPGPIHRSYTTAFDSNIVPLAKRRSVVMNLIVMSAYLFCWTPLAALYVIRNIKTFRHDLGFQTIHDLSSFLALAKLCLNPAIYSFFDNAIRDQLCRCRCNNSNEQVVYPEKCIRGKLSELSVSKIAYSSINGPAANTEPLLLTSSNQRNSYKATTFNTEKLAQMIANTRRYRSFGMFTSRSSNI
ncbi:QRFP-like peptide receptor [Exaiptasia diaphana]|uniref:G-protein coupled receptors family 1 profile domain-containing protein n=1 Tax=Exaiptasia diaphana TaxID=2652724 RepID=A0A913Y226_EXADI|nr:QRFP-like peptide receptor [Exaiptasia diaphana]